MNLYGLKFTITDNVPSFQKTFTPVKKYNAKKGIYYSKYDKEKISKYSVDSHSNSYGWYWYTSQEKRVEAKEFLLNRYIEKTQEWIESDKERAIKRQKDLKITKKYYDMMFKK